MKIDTALIEGYAEMSAEEKLEALENYEYEDNAEQISKLKRQLSKANTEAAEYKRKQREAMDEDERAKQEREEELNTLREENKALKKEKDVSTYTSKYLALGYDKDLAKETAEAYVEGDTDKVFENQQKFLTSHDKAYKAELMQGKGSTPPAGEGTTSITKDEILKIKDTTERQAAIKAHPELFGIQIE